MNKSLRTCLYTNKQYPRQELIRLVKVNGKLTIDLNKNMQGRGYYLKLSNEALNDKKLITVLSKRTKSSIDEDLIQQLKSINK